MARGQGASSGHAVTFSFQMFQRETGLISWERIGMVGGVFTLLEGIQVEDEGK